MNWIKRLFGGGSTGDGDGAGSSTDMMSCEEAIERLYEYLDDELESLESERVAEHFRICQRCYPHVNFEKAFLAAVNRSQTDEAAPQDLKSRIMRALQEEGLEPG